MTHPHTPPPRPGRKVLLALAASCAVHALLLLGTSTLEPRRVEPRGSRIELSVVHRPRPAPDPKPAPPPATPPQTSRRSPPRAPAPKTEPPPPMAPVPQPAPEAPEAPEATAAPAPAPTVAMSQPTPTGTPDGVPRAQPGGGGGGTRVGAPGLFLGPGAAARLALNKDLVTQPPPAPSLQEPAWKHRSFFAQVKSFIAQRWRPEKVLRQHARAGRLRPAQSGKTVVELAVDESGRVRATEVVQRGGAAWLDEEAVRAARAAGPFPNPPRALFGSDGLLRFRFAFHVTVAVPGAISRLLRPADNVLDAVLGAVSDEVPDSLYCFGMIERRARDSAEEELALHARMEPCRGP